MNPKIALFLSTTLTAFVVATLSGVVNKVSSAPAPVVNTVAPIQAEVQLPDPTATEQQAEQSIIPSEAPTQALMDPMQATTIAAKAIGHEDVYSVESSTYNGVDAYKVVFSSGDVVYIGLDAQVLAMDKLKPVVVSVAATNLPKKHKDKSNTQPSSSGGSEHESEGSEHENDD